MIEKVNFAYVSIVFKKNYAGEVKHELQYVPIISDLYYEASPARILVEASLIIFFVYYIVQKVIYDLKNGSTVYNNYLSMNIESQLQPVLMYHRRRMMPESFRKMHYLFDIGKILDITFNIFLGLGIGAWFVLYLFLKRTRHLIAKIPELSEQEMIQLYDNFYEVSKVKEWGRVFECMTIVVLSIKILTYLSHFHSLKVIIITLKESTRMILPMLFIMIGYICSFSFMIHFLYGS